jgi:branched-chain amino acid transport system permease protein
VVNALSLGGLYALFTLGIALLFGVMQLVNFAYGELIMVAGYALYLLRQSPTDLAITAAIATAVLVALLMERVAFRPIRGANPATLLITSFAVSYLLQNIANLIFGADARPVNLFPNLLSAVTIGSIVIPKLDFVVIGVTFGLMFALGLFLVRTPIGLQMRAAAEDFRMAQICGVRSNRVIATAFALSGILAGVAGILLAVQTGVVYPTVGLSPVLVAFVATILGGLGSLRGAVLGGFLLGILTVALQAYLPFVLRDYRDALAYSVVLLVLLVRPQGLVVAKSVVTRV